LYLHFVERRIAFLRELKRTETQLADELEEELERLVRLFPTLRRYFASL
jgi:hypothetical protein